jgi:hypothetical protein
MKSFDVNWSGPELSYSNAPAVGLYSVSNGLVHYSLKVDINAVEEWGEGPYSITLPVEPAMDYIFRGGGFFLNGGMHLPLSIMARGGVKKAFLGYTALNGEDIPITSKVPVILRAIDTFFYSSGTYFGKDVE